ncbi:PREDICTED: protein CBFA2T2 [Polistes dominula]|uniref:Protein CBFA2T2 n=1 Tax=Polistes dominula TaxID=743375 RepID=A0ABM1IHS0_POLDO|nr:PREDICTED: protein CBFA2T2 [Polistes dominula]XP_015179757.1 PREDICTED: protein CBFA2T2 [Polistes dominula]XP_015179758.1 PREDICTED: protein CBFA2T2 [Polistes dominula]
MKVDGGVASTTVPQKVKVKEEAKECCSFQQVSATLSGGSSGSNSVVVVVSTAASTTTTATGTVIATTSSNCNSNGLTTVGVAAATLASTSTITTTTTAPTTSSTSNSLQTSAIICHHQSTPVTVVANSTAQTPEPLPVDLDLKSKNKASPTNSGRDKTSRDENNHSEALSPSSQQHQRHGLSTQTNGSHSEYKGQLGCSMSSDNDSPMSSQPLKPDVEESNGGTSIGTTSAGPISVPPTVTASTTSGLTATCRNEEQIEASPLSNGVRCITGFFAGHGKLKRLLGTLVQFATDISADTGDTVRTLVLALLSGTMTAEEFHSALQEATNFPLRGFVLPYLKHTLPSLQRDLNTAARASNQTCAQFLRNNETTILEAVGLVQSGESVEIFGEHGGNGIGSGNTSGNQCPVYYSMRSNSNPNVGAIQHSNNATNALHHYSGSSSHAPKRRASDTPYYENGTLLEDVPVYGKKPNPWGAHHQQQQQQQQHQQPQQTENSSSYCWYHPLHAAGGSIQGHGHGHGHGPSPVPPSLVQINQINAFSTPHHLSQQQQQLNHIQNGSSFDDEWKNIHVMLNCILGMVEKTKRALAILQRRGCSSPASTPVQPANVIVQNGNANNTTGNNPSTNGVQVESSTGDRDGSLKRLSGEIVAQTIRATEDRVAEVKRRAEEAVLEVKRAAVAEVQRAVAVAVAESRASERLRVHRLLDLPLSQRSHVGVRQASFVRVHGSSNVVDTNGRTAPTPTNASNSAPSATEDDKDTHLTNIVGSSCWNCGRPALETCGGCGIARYCGSFCQHRDWEAGGHHATCNNPLPREPRRSSSRSPPRIGTANVTGSINDAEGSTVSAATANTISKGK